MKKKKIHHITEELKNIQNKACHKNSEVEG